MIGVQPGPLLFSQHPDIINSLFVGFMAAQFLILAMGFLSARIFPRILRVSLGILFPIVITLCFLGAYYLGNSIYDIGLSLVFGVIGYFMKKHGFSAAPVILGIMLGPIAEQELGRALIISHGDWTVLFK